MVYTINMFCANILLYKVLNLIARPNYIFVAEISLHNHKSNISIACDLHTARTSCIFVKVKNLSI